MIIVRSVRGRLHLTTAPEQSNKLQTRRNKIMADEIVGTEVELINLRIYCKQAKQKQAQLEAQLSNAEAKIAELEADVKGLETEIDRYAARG
jgi:cell division protein FtsB